MGTKALTKLLIALVVIGGIAAIVHFIGKGGGISQQNPTTAKKKVFDDFPLNDVAGIVLKAKEGSINLVKGKKSWEVAERDNFPAKTATVSGLLKDIWDLKIVQPQQVGRSQYGRVGLLDPADKTAGENESASVLTFFDKDKKELGSLWLGKVYEKSENRPNPFGGGMAMSDAGRYVKRGDSNFVYLVGETFKDVTTEASEWLNDDFFKVEKIKSIAIKSENAADDWKLVREDENGDFAFANKKQGELDLDSTKTSSMKSAFANPSMEDVFTSEDAKENKTDKTSFAIETFEGFTYDISVGEKNDLNELPLTVKVSGKFQEKRKEGEEESDEEKKTLDEEFAANLKKLKDKLAKEKALEGRVFKVRSYLVDSITKKRSELLKEKEEPKEGEGAESSPAKKGEEIAPGVKLPLPPATKPKANKAAEKAGAGKKADAKANTNASKKPQAEAAKKPATAPKKPKEKKPTESKPKENAKSEASPAPKEKGKEAAKPAAPKPDSSAAKPKDATDNKAPANPKAGSENQ